jgi:hypothetical protein
MELVFPGHPARWVTVPVSRPGVSTRETRAAAEAQLAGMSLEELERLFASSKPGPPFTQEIDLSIVSELRARTATASYVGTLHCPTCAAPLARGIVALPLAVECGGCGRRVSTKRDGRRLVVEIEIE